MYTLRCTQRLLKRLRLPLTAADSVEATTTTLGDWYANLHHQHHRPWVLAVSERTVLPVILPLAGPKASPLHERFRAAVDENLAACGVAPDVRARELSAMDGPPAIGRTVNKSIVATLSQFGIDLRFMWAQYPDTEPQDLASHLARSPTKVLSHDSPDRSTRKLLGGEPERQLQAEAALHTLGQFRFRQFIEGVRGQTACLAVQFMADALEARYDLERVFFTGESSGFTLDVDQVAPTAYRIAFGIVGKGGADSSGTWLVRFDDDNWRVQRIEAEDDGAR